MSLHGQRVALAAVAVVNVGEAWILFRQGSQLCVLNLLIASACVALLVATWPKQPPD